ncbi:MAG: type II secretion system protein [Betaproteobacteria bacterium]|nr:MAG: type II secretion system protein [Betaproteobacteria bacterium]
MCITERRRARGVTLLELIVFIIVVSVAVVGVLTALDLSNRSSTDPMIQKQALAIAEALLEEVQLQPFTYCDPDDANAATALNAAGCTGGANGANDESKLPLGPETGETRTGGVTPYDNVSDYNLFCMGPTCIPASSVSDINGSAISGLGAYNASVAVAQLALGAIPAAESLLVTVTVTGPSSITVKLDGYRVRYAPNALP